MSIKHLIFIKDTLLILFLYIYVKKYHLIDKEDALFKIHQPQTRSDVISALRYLKYEEIFLNFK